MKIKYKERSIGLKFRDLDPGEVFRHSGGAAFMKTELKINGMATNAVRLSDGSLYDIHENADVEKIHGAFVEGNEE